MRNLKKLFAVVVVIAVMLTTMIPAAFAEGTTSLSADAQACATLGMLQGDGNGVTYAYTQTQPARIQAAIMLLRLKGLEAAAQATPVTADNFSDVTAAWQKPFTAYLKAHPELGFAGIGNNKFDPNSLIDAKQYYSVMLTVLGYSGDYTWATVMSKAAQVGLTKNLDITKLTVNDMAVATVEALKTNLKGTDTSLIASLVDSGAIKADVAAASGLYVATPSTLAITSVTALNRDQILVTFNQKVDKTTAEDKANYKLNNAPLSTPAVTDATLALQADGKSVLITAGSTGGFVWNATAASCTLQTSKGFVVIVDNVKNLAGTLTASGLTSASFTYNDIVAPSITSVTASAITSTKSVTVKFSEPVQGVGLYTINGSVATFTTPTLPTDTLTLTATQDLVANTNYTLQAINEKDAAGNLLATNPQQSGFTVTIDTSAPTVVSATPVNDSTIRVTFSKKMNASTLTATSNIKLLTMNGSDINNTTTQIVTISATSGDTTGTQFDVVFSGSAAKAAFDTTSKQLLLNAIFTSNIKDSLGNVLASTNKAITLTLNQAAPVITSVQYVKPGATYDGSARATGAIVLTFNEGLASAPTLAATTDYTAITDGGIDETTTVGALTGSFKTNSDSKIVILQPATALAGTNTETIRFNGNIFTDNTLGANKNAAVVVTVDLKNGLVSSDTSAPVISTIAVSANNITVNMGEAISGLDTTTVLNVANYRLNGAAMPSGTYITVSGAVATLNLPAGSIASTGSYAVTVTGIKDAAGNAAATAVGNVTLTDNTKPTLKTITFNSNGTVTLAFDENVTAAVAADFSISVNGGTALTSPAGYTIAAGVGADDGKVVVTFVTPLVAGDKVTVTTSGSATGHDADSNVLAGGVTVSATK